MKSTPPLAARNLLTVVRNLHEVRSKIQKRPDGKT